MMENPSQRRQDKIVRHNKGNAQARGRLRRPRVRLWCCRCHQSHFRGQCFPQACDASVRGVTGRVTMKRDALFAAYHARDMFNVVYDSIEVGLLRVRTHVFRNKVDLRSKARQLSPRHRRRALSWRNGTRTITTPSRWPGPVPTCRRISSGTFRETSHTARAPEWLHITGAREILSAASAVASDVCERSTRTPRRLSSPTSVSPNWLSPHVQFSALERTGEGGEPEIGVAPEPVVEWLGCLQYSTRIRECVVAGVG
jgi:hypothetical protein